jgi:CRISPR/Cas system-associated exonuclease Cas4 (RecB family)
MIGNGTWCLPMTDKQLPKSFTFSQSSLQDFHDCEKRFLLKYIERLAWPSIEVEPILENERRQIEGQKFHRLIQQHLLGIPSELLEKQSGTFPLSQWWQNYIHSDLHLEGNTLLPETALIASMGNHKITAKYDLIAIDGNKFRILDWKTYQKRPSESTMRLHYQTKVYCWLLATIAPTLINNQNFDPENLEMIYWFANFPSQPIKITYSEAQFEKDRQHLENMIGRIEGKSEFKITEDESKCRFCVYRSYCDRGVGAGVWDEEYEISMDMPDFKIDQIEEIEF